MEDIEKRKKGRPFGSKSKKPTRSKPLWLRVTDTEKAQIVKLAKDGGYKNTSEYIRRKSLGAG